MKLSFRLWKWIVLLILSVVGGFMMYLINEEDGIFEIWQDNNLFVNLGSSIFSVALFLYASYQLAKITPRILPFRKRTVAYYLKFFCLQFLISGGGSLLLAIAFAAAIVYRNNGIWLGETSYFRVDFFFVCLAVIALQIILFMFYFFCSFQQVHDDQNREQDMEQEADYVRLLEEVKVYQLTLGEGLLDIPCLEKLEGIDVDDIDYIYSEQKMRFIQSKSQGKTMLDGITLEKLIGLLPKEGFFLAGRHLIVSRKAIVSYSRLEDYSIQLILDPPIHLKTKLSETATRLFKTWYHGG